MRFYTMVCVISVLTASLTGCSAHSGNSTESSYTPAHDRAASTMVEIDFAADLNFDDAKTRELSNIASRPHLSARSQVYLVKKAMKSLSFDENKRDVLLALINNPYFVAEGRQAVLDQLDSFSFDSTKKSLVNAINARGHIPSERELRKIQKEQRQSEKAEPLSAEINGVQVQMHGAIEFNAGSKID